MRKETKAFLTGAIAVILVLIPLYLSASTLTYVADTGNNRIQVFDPMGGFVTSWGKFGKDAGNMDSPAAIAIGSRGEYVYVADTGNNRVLKFDSAGNFIAAWGGPVYGNANGQFSTPNSLAVNFENNTDYVYVADTGNNRLQKFDSNGNWIMTIGSTTAGSAPGRLNNPQGVTADNTRSYIYAVDTGNNRIQKFDINGNFIAAWGGYGTDDGKFKFPRDIAVDSHGRVYVADCLNYRIERFTPDGIFDAKWGAQGESNGQFDDHYGVSVDADDNIYVADAGNNRVQKFTPDGVWLATIGSLQQGINPGEFYYPMGVEVYFLQQGVPTFTPTNTYTFTNTYTSTPTDTFTSTPTNTNTFTDTNTFTPTYTFTPTDTFTSTPTNSYTSTPTNTDTFTQTSTFTFTSTSTFTHTDTYTPTNTFTQTSTFTFTSTNTFTQTDTYTPTNTFTQTSTFTFTSTNTFTQTDTFTFTATNTFTSIPVSIPENTPTNVKTPDCTLSYRIDMDERSVTKGKMPDMRKYSCKHDDDHMDGEGNGSAGACKGISLKKFADEDGGYIYLYQTGSLNISVFDRDGCFADDVQFMIDGKRGRNTHYFAGWFAREGLKKFVAGLISPEYLIAMELKTCDRYELTVKETPMPYEEMSESNVYNYPNPCNGRTAIRFSLPEPRKTDIMIYDITGKLVWQKHLDVYAVIPGVNYVQWDGMNDYGMQAANGTYIFRVISGGKVVTKKIVIVR